MKLSCLVFRITNSKSTFRQNHLFLSKNLGYPCIKCLSKSIKIGILFYLKMDITEWIMFTG